MLARLIREKMNDEGMSVRRASREIGVAHTTIGRILEGDDPSYETLQKISEWLGTNPELLASLDRDGATGEAAKLVGILVRHPELRDKLGEALERYEEDEFSEDDIKNILEYISFRLQ